MTKNEIIAELCRLTAIVGDKQFNNKVATDCFCGHIPDRNYQFSKEAFDFIYSAVMEKINLNSKADARDALRVAKAEGLSRVFAIKRVREQFGLDLRTVVNLSKEMYGDL